MNPLALVSFKKCICPPPLPYFKVNICPFPLPHFASIFFAYLWSFRWPDYIVTLLRSFSFRLPHLNIPTGPPSDELDKNIQRTLHGLFFSQITNKRKLLTRSGEGQKPSKGRCLPWSKEEEGGIYIFWMKQVPVGSLHFIFWFFDSA